MITHAKNTLPVELASHNEALIEAREYAGTPAYRALASLLREIEQGYLTELRTITPDALLKTQGKLLQAQALRQLVEGHPHVDGRA